MIIYTLTEYHYDWYEFSEFKFASRKLIKLTELANSEELNPHGYKIVYVGFDEKGGQKVNDLIEKQQSHFRIERVELV